MILFDHFIRIPPLKASLRSLRCGFFFCRGFKYLRTSPKSHHPYSWRCNLRREERDSRRPPPLNPRFAASFRHRTASDGFSLGPQFGSRCPPLFSGFNSSFFFPPPPFYFFWPHQSLAVLFLSVPRHETNGTEEQRFLKDTAPSPCGAQMQSQVLRFPLKKTSSIPCTGASPSFFSPPPPPRPPSVLTMTFCFFLPVSQPHNVFEDKEDAAHEFGGNAAVGSVGLGVFFGGGGSGSI